MFVHLVVMALAVLAVIPSEDCPNVVYKWREKSDKCPQCRIKLSKEEPFLRDYVLERIAEKYAKVTLSSEELVERDKLVTYSYRFSSFNRTGSSIKVNDKRRKMT